MEIPDFQSLMLPVLGVVATAGELSSKEVRDRVAASLGIDDAAREELLPSGRQPRYNNRVAWALIYLTRAGIIASARRGVYRATERAADVLRGKPSRIDLAFLAQFPEYKEWRSRSASDTGNDDSDEVSTTASGQSVSTARAATPDEQIAEGYRRSRTAVEEELLRKIMDQSPTFFESLVVELLVKMGYGGSQVDAGRALGRSGDGGIDGLIKEDKLGLDAIYIQAKRWALDRKVGRPDIQAFAGSLEGRRARKGVFLTTASYTNEAHEYVKQIEKRIVLIGGRELVALMFDHGVAVANVQTYEVKRVDIDYFDEQ